MSALVSTLVAAALMSSMSLAQSEDNLRKSAPNVPPTSNNPARGAGSPEMPKGSVKMATVHLLEPADGATVEKTFKMKFAVDGFKVVPAGAIVPGTGHFHVIVDGEPSKEGAVVPVDATHIHYGKGQTEADLTLASGAHTLTLQFADGAHRAYGPSLSQTIHITVK